MKVYAINGSPRKNRNTATLLQKAIEGVKESSKNINVEIETEIVNLYDLQYTGCKSCFACKRLESPTYGKCIIRDDLYEVLEKLSNADGIIFGSPIYFGTFTGQLHSMLERWLFPNLVYDKNHSSIAPKKMPTAFIYTMNISEKVMIENDYMSSVRRFESFVERMFTKPSVIYSNDTYQFDDYSKYKNEVFLESEKAVQRETQFPKDCQNAFALGRQLVKSVCI